MNKRILATSFIIVSITVALLIYNAVGKMGMPLNLINQSDWMNGSVVVMVNRKPSLIYLGQNNALRRQLIVISGEEESRITIKGKNNLPDLDHKLSVYTDHSKEVNYYYHGETLVGIYGIHNNIATLLYKTDYDILPIIQPGNTMNFDVVMGLKSMNMVPLDRISVLEYIPGGKSNVKPYTSLYEQFHILCYANNYILYLGLSPRKNYDEIRSIGIFNKEYIASIPLFQVLSRNAMVRCKLVITFDDFSFSSD